MPDIFSSFSAFASHYQMELIGSNASAGDPSSALRFCLLWGIFLFQALLCFEQRGLSLLGSYFPVCALEYFFCVRACDLIRVISIQ